MKARFLGTAAMPDASFMQQVLVPLFGLVNGSLNLERVALAPPFTADDAWLIALTEGRVDSASGLVDVATPPYRRYPGNLNQIGSGGNPLASLLEESVNANAGCTGKNNINAIAGKSRH